MFRKLFFNPKFEQCIDELGLRQFTEAVSARNLAEFRDYGRDVTGASPEEAAARAFRDLVLKNAALPIEARLELSFRNIHTLKVWHFDDKVNIDLHTTIRATVEQLVDEYVGAAFKREYFETLGGYGVKVPIAHDTLHALSLAFLYIGKRAGLASKDSALKLYRDVLIDGPDNYDACLTPEGAEAVKTIQGALGRRS
jgi:hypothetical protein